jgi:hypothetical protein
VEHDKAPDKRPEPTPEAARARRLEDVIRKGRRPPKTPHEFVEDRMRHPGGGPPAPGRKKS